MQARPTPIAKDLVLVGGGHSHVQVIRSFGMRPIAGVRLTLICRDVDTPYSGMLPGLVAGHYGFDQTHIDLGRLCRFAGVRLFLDEACGLDLDHREVICRDRPPVPYDLLSINVGSAPATSHVPGAAEYAVPVKPIDRFYDHWRRLVARAQGNRGPMRIGVVGAGAAGVELLLSVRHRLRQEYEAHGADPEALEFTLITKSDQILPTHARRVRAAFERMLDERGVDVVVSRAVSAVDERVIRLDDDRELELDEILWVVNAAPQRWLGESGLATDDAGFVRVDATLQSTSHPGVFAAGDVASVVGQPRPKSGVFAVRQGPPLTDNLRRALHGWALRPFVAQKHFLSLISAGDRYAVASWGPIGVGGRWLWRLKDWIDRRFMSRFGNELPEMEESEPPLLPAGVASEELLEQLRQHPMRCGGCGAKVGASVLSRVTASLDVERSEDVVLGLADPDDAAVVDVGGDRLSVQSVDLFRAMIDDPYALGQIAANHALGDIYAMGAEPQTAMALVTVPFGPEEKVEAELKAMMAGATRILNEAGATLVGGHTSEGVETSIGFAVTGLVHRSRLMTKAGLKVGQKIVLTKPIGTGTLLAADMRGEAKGRWIRDAVICMVQSNAGGAACLTDCGATGCTDVTGFGLLGHLVEMLRGGKVGATLELGSIPLLEGAEECVRAGIVSSLQPQNLRLRRSIANLDEVSSSDRFPLLFDPQTAGGLLATVAPERIDDCVDALRRAGYGEAAVIGEICERDPEAPPIRVVPEQAGEQ